ncbi:hypothetical protein ACOMHN_023939 [Nucella lapillus]
MVPLHTELFLLLCLQATVFTAEDIQPQTNTRTSPASTPKPPVTAQPAVSQDQAGVLSGSAPGGGPGAVGAGAPSLPQTDLKQDPSLQLSGDSEPGTGSGGPGHDDVPSLSDGKQTQHSPPSQAADPDLTGQQGIGNPQGGGSAGITANPAHPGEGGVKTPGDTATQPAGTEKKETPKTQRGSSPANGTRSSAQVRQTLNNMKYATLTIFMSMIGVAAMVVVVISTLSRRRRRQYDRCRGLGDHCELRSNFQLVNHDERLGIRTSSNYLM